MSLPRTLPLRLEPLPGEALDSWFEALAHRLHTPLGELLPQLGLPRPEYRERTRDIPSEWTVMLRGHEVDMLGAVTRTPPEEITAMTLAAYAGRAVLIDPATRHVNRRLLWGRASGSRYCPACLEQTGGRWKLSWRLGWSFACLEHRCLLADACPACGRVPRRRPHPRLMPVRPGTCPHPGTGEERAQRCGGDLHEATVLTLSEGHPALAAQQYLWKIIDSGVAGCGVYADHPVPAAEALADIRAIAVRALAETSTDELARRLPGDLLAAYQQARAHEPVPHGPARTDARPGFMAPSHAAVAAVGVAAAVEILTADGLRQAAERMRWLTTEARSRGVTVTATTLNDWGKGTSPALLGIQLASLEGEFRPSDRLRYRTSGTLPCHPERGRDRAQTLSRSTPGLLWPRWTARLSPGTTWDRFLRPALAACVLITGTRTEIDDAAAQLGGAINPANTSRILNVLEDTPGWPQITAALTRLADHLAQNPSPIDYRRRRTLDYTNLLPDKQWEAICRTTGAFRGKGRKPLIARAYLFHRLSKLPLEFAPAVPTAKDNFFRNSVAEFATNRFPELAAALDDAAHDFLARHGITDEPVAWQPPLTLVSDLDLPGPDPGNIDVSELHRLLLAGRSPRKAAAELNTTLTAVRCVLEEHPTPARRVRRGQGTLPGPRSGAIKHISKDELARLHLEENLSFPKIAERLGTDRHTVRELAHHHGIPTQHGRRPKATITREWLHEQHIVHGRTLVELAHSVGVSPATMNRWAKIHQIPARRFGTHTHHPDLRGNLHTVPEILRPALTGPASWKRLRVLAELPTHPDLAAAAKALNLDRATVWSYLDRLEKELSGRLVHRSGKRRRTTTPTTFGLQVIQAIHGLEQVVR